MAVPVFNEFIRTLRSVRNRPKEEPERCSFCGHPIPADHRHMINTVTRQFMCVCETCVITQSIHGEFSIIPERYIFLEDFVLPETVWADFLIPVNMAFFINSSLHPGMVAYYPAAAGATESKLKMAAWKKLQVLNPVVESLKPDLEALLVNRLDEAGEYFIVPVDCCYKLIGIIRKNWKGIHGGREVQVATRKFFDELKNKSLHA